MNAVQTGTRERTAGTGIGVGSTAVQERGQGSVCASAFGSQPMAGGSIFESLTGNAGECDARRYRKMEQIGNVCQLPTQCIVPNPGQPRKHFDDNSLIRLADSIRRYGILQPLAVRIAGEGSAYYELVAGERRLRAARLLRLEKVPCIIIHADSQRSAELAMIENIQRENLNMFEQASAIASLIETYHMTQEQIARRLSSSQSYVANKLRLLRLTDDERELILRCGLTERHARAVLKLPRAEDRLAALERIASRRMNVASTEEYIERLLSEIKTEPVRRLEYRLLRQDIRLFYNTVDRAVDTVRRAGIGIRSARREVGDSVELVISIDNPYRDTGKLTA